MPFTLSTGEEVGLREWNMAQATLALEWKLRHVEDLNDADAVHVWAISFAKEARKICEERCVPIDIFIHEMRQFIDSIVDDILLLKHLISEEEGRDVGLEKTFKRTYISSVPLIGRFQQDIGAELDLVLPFVNESKENKLRCLEIPRHAGIVLA